MEKEDEEGERRVGRHLQSSTIIRRSLDSERYLLFGYGGRDELKLDRYGWGVLLYQKPQILSDAATYAYNTRAVPAAKRVELKYRPIQ